MGHLFLLLDWSMNLFTPDTTSIKQNHFFPQQSLKECFFFLFSAFQILSVCRSHLRGHARCVRVFACVYVACLLWHPSGVSCQDRKGYGGNGTREEERKKGSRRLDWWPGGGRRKERKKKSWGLTVLSRGEFALVYKCVCACVIHYSDWGKWKEASGQGPRGRRGGVRKRESEWKLMSWRDGKLRRCL